MARERGLWLMLLGLVIVGELLTRPGLSPTGDGIVHTLRILEMHRLWEAGVFYPRWAPDLVFGLGYPLFHFNAPLFPWLGALAMELGFNPEASVKLLLALLIAFGSAGVYRLARRWGIGELGAMVAGLAYAYTPFRVRELYWLGDFPQYLGLSLLPWVLDAFHACLREGGWLRYWLAGAMYGLLQLSHSITAMLGTIVLAGYGVLIWVAERPPLRRITGALKAFVLGIGLAAFFIFPALLGRSLVHLTRVLEGYFDFRNHFLSPERLISFVPVRDQSQGNPEDVLTFGAHQVMLALGSLISWGKLACHQRVLAVGAWMGMGGIIWLMMEPSSFIWELLPLLPYAQHPWRWLGVAGIPVALLIGLGLEGFKRPGWRILGAALTSLVLIVGVAPLLYPSGEFIRLHHITLTDLHTIDRILNWIGLTSAGELLPRTVTAPKISGSPLEEAYRRGEEPIRLDFSSLPSGAEAVPLSLHPLDQRFQVYLPAEAILRFWVFAFPGWQVMVDGYPAETWAGGELGLLHALVPSGRHEVRLCFCGHWGWQLLEVFSAGLWLLGLMRWLVHRFQERRSEGGIQTTSSSILSWKEGVALGIFWVLISSFKFFYVDPHTDWFRFRSDPNMPSGMAVLANVDFGGQIRLLGYTISVPNWRAKPGDTVVLTLWWRGLREMETQYSVYVHGLEALWPNRLRFQSDHMAPGNVPTTASQWRGEYYIRDVHRLHIPLDLPPGPYHIKVGLYKTNNPGVCLITDEGNDGYLLPTLLVNRPMPVSARLPEPIRFGGSLELVGVELPAHIKRGEPWSLWFYWRAISPVKKSYVFFVHRLDALGQMRGQQDRPPYWETNHWPPGEIVAVPVTLEGISEPGSYRLRVGWYEWPSMEHLRLSSGEHFAIVPRTISVR